MIVDPKNFKRKQKQKEYSVEWAMQLPAHKEWRYTVIPAGDTL